MEFDPSATHVMPGRFNPNESYELIYFDPTNQRQRGNEYFVRWEMTRFLEGLDATLPSRTSEVAGFQQQCIAFLQAYVSRQQSDIPASVEGETVSLKELYDSVGRTKLVLDQLL